MRIVHAVPIVADTGTHRSEIGVNSRAQPLPGVQTEVRNELNAAFGQNQGGAGGGHVGGAGHAVAGPSAQAACLDGRGYSVK